MKLNQRSDRRPSLEGKHDRLARKGAGRVTKARVLRLKRLLLELLEAFRRRAATGARMAIGAAVLCGATAGSAVAGPQGEQVVAGSATVRRTVESDVLKTTIRQTSDRAVIDWRKFDIDKNEWVEFRQPGAASVTLNRVTGSERSVIQGLLTGNGQVYLVNPNGILFSKDARVDVAGLTASTANISNADFMAGRMRFDQPGRPDATVVNEGTITVSEGGLVALAGRQVANHGVIQARLGKVTLAAGDAFVLDLYGDQLVNLILDGSVMDRVTDAQGVRLSARVDHSGTILADGGRVQLSVATARQLLDNVINVTGAVRATSVGMRDGKISLRGDDATAVHVSGTLQANGERGGRVEVTGRDVTLTPQARVDVFSGSSASGGQVTVQAAQNLTLGTELNSLGGAAGGGVSLTAGQNLQVNETVAVKDGSLSLKAERGEVRVAEGKTLHAGQGAIEVAGGGGVRVGAIQTSGDVTLRSASGDVRVSQPVMGAAGENGQARPVGSLAVEGRGTIELAGALAARQISVTSREAGVMLRGGVLQSQGGGVEVRAPNGGISGEGVAVAGDAMLQAGAPIQVNTVLASGRVTLNTTVGGDVTVQQPIGGLIAGTAARGVVVDAAGSVNLNGVRAGTEGITITARAGDVSAATQDAGLVSEGHVAVTAQQGRVGSDSVGLKVSSNAGVQLDGRKGVQADTVIARAGMLLRAQMGGVTAGSGGLLAEGGDIGLAASGDVVLQGPVQAKSGHIEVTSTEGAVRAKVTEPGPSPTPAGDATLIAGTPSTGGTVKVTALKDVELGEVQAQGGLFISSREGDVMLLKPLGGPNTGYDKYEDGYQEKLRPNVGRVVVEAPNGSVELNGLNLDGNADPKSLDAGLSVKAGRVVISNDKIAVNKGDIELAGGQGERDGVFLGNSIYSRGHDPAVSGTETDKRSTDPSKGSKSGYSIIISGKNLAVFDNTDEIAILPGLYKLKNKIEGRDVYVDASGFFVNEKNGERVTDANGNFYVYRKVNIDDINYYYEVLKTDGEILPSGIQLGDPVPRVVGKIELSINSANYILRNGEIESSPVLVPVITEKYLPSIDIRASSIKGLVSSENYSRISIKKLSEISLDSMKNIVSRPSEFFQYKDEYGGYGVMLKILAYHHFDDRKTLILPENPRILLALDNNETISDVYYFKDDSYKNATQTESIEFAGLVKIEIGAGNSIDVFVSQVGLYREYNEGENKITEFIDISGRSSVKVNGVLDDNRKISNKKPNGGINLNLTPMSDDYSGYYKINKISLSDGGDRIKYGAEWKFFVENYFSDQYNKKYSIDPGVFIRIASRYPLTEFINMNYVVSDGYSSGVKINSGAVDKKFDTRSGQGSGASGAGVQYSLSGIFYDISSYGCSKTCLFYQKNPEDQSGVRVSVYDGIIADAAGKSKIDQNSHGFIPGTNIPSGKNDSRTGYASVTPSNSAIRINVANASASNPTGSTLPGASVAPVVGGIDRPELPPASGPTQSATNDLALPPRLTLDASTGTALPTAEEFIDPRPAAQADLGRSGGVSGPAPNVFSRSYRLATTSDPALCGPATTGANERSRIAPVVSCTAGVQRGAGQ